MDQRGVEAEDGVPSTTPMAYLFTDVEGSTTRWEADEQDMSSRLERHDQLLRATFVRHGGQVFSIAGDSFGVAFDSLSVAVAAAVDVQRALVAEQVLPVRIGVHVGVAHARADNYFGTAVNKAARIMSIGHGGQVLLSTAASAAALGDDLSLLDLGAHRLKDLSGTEHVWQVRGPGLPSEFPPLTAAGPDKHNLPTMSHDLIGRAAEFGAVVDLLGERRLVTILGPGGVGKTRLSLDVGAALVDTADDGVWFVDLAPVSDRGGVDVAVAAAMRIPNAIGLSGGIAAAAAQREAILIMDNCEHLVDDIADFVESTLELGTGVRVVATSQVALGLDGEQQVRLDGLATGDDGTAEALFVDRARLVDPSFEPDVAAASLITSICRRLDGLPLAIEMAASRIGMLSLPEIDDRLAERFELLVGRRRSHDRHRTLRATIAWSVELLEDDERRVLEKLAVFVGPFRLDAAEHVAGDGGRGVAFMDLVGSLHARSLLTTTDRSGHRLFQSVRAFALAELERTGGLGGARDRHLEWHASWADGLKSWHVTPLRRVHGEVEASMDDLIAAFEHARSERRTEEAHRLVLGVANSLCFLDLALADRLLGALEAWPTNVPPAWVDRRELARAQYEQVTGEFPSLVARCEALCADASLDVLPAATNLLANSLVGDPARATELAGDARAQFEAMGDQAGVDDVDVTLAAIDLYDCRPQDALGRGLQNMPESLHGHFNLLGALAMAGDHVALHHELDSIARRGLALTLDHQFDLLVAIADAQAGSSVSAYDHLVEAIRLTRRTPMPLCAEECLLTAAIVTEAGGDQIRAIELLASFRSSGPAPYRTAPAIGLYRMQRKRLAEHLGPEAFGNAWSIGRSVPVDRSLDRVIAAGPVITESENP